MLRSRTPIFRNNGINPRSRIKRALQALCGVPTAIFVLKWIACFSVALSVSFPFRRRSRHFFLERVGKGFRDRKGKEKNIRNR